MSTEGIWHVNIPELGLCLHPGMYVKIGRFSKITWLLQHGWFSFSGNREICGWYLVNVDNIEDIRPLQKIDLVDIYSVEIQ